MGYLFIALAVFLLSPEGYRLEVVSTTHHPPNPHQDYQQKLLLALNELLLNKCQENQSLKELQTSTSDIKKILASQLNPESEKRIKFLEETFQNLSKNVADLDHRLQKLEPLGKTIEKSCYDILKSGNTVSGVHVIRPIDSPAAFAVRCNMDVMGGGWTYILNRYDGSQNFFLKWEDYKKGFGDLKGEFWLGLEHLYMLTGSEDNELLIELVDWENKKAYAKYDQFRLGSEAETYSIKVLKGFRGDAGDSLSSHVGLKFSTHDRDNDNLAQNCAVSYHGAWWYDKCYACHLTGTHFDYSADNAQGMTWHQFRQYHSLKEARMMVRTQD